MSRDAIDKEIDTLREEIHNAKMQHTDTKIVANLIAEMQAFCTLRLSVVNQIRS